MKLPSSFIESSIYLYITVYIIATIVLLVVVFKLIEKIKTLFKNLEPINNSVEHINKDLDALNEKNEKIKYTREHSIPFFVRIFFIFTVLRAAYKDFSETKSSKRSLRKSLNKAYRYESTLRENRLLKRG